MKRKVLLIYTGGTIGMKKDYTTDSLVPFDFSHIFEEIPELSKIDCQLDIQANPNPIDSSDMAPENWKLLALRIRDNYDAHDGFVVLHGSDTMAYTASALSFMLENLAKPVIFTGSQLPIGTLRTDGKENLITAIEIAGHYENDIPVVPEVAIYFEYSLYRGNRAIKIDAQHFRAFETPNYPFLANAGVNIKYYKHNINAVPTEPFSVFPEMDSRVAFLRFFPGISAETVRSICLNPEIKGLVLETFGSGNVPNNLEIIGVIKEAIEKGLIVLNVSQCIGGSVNQGQYYNSKILKEIGVVGGGDITSEAAIVKMMFLLARYDNRDEVKAYLGMSLRGELTIND